MRLGGLREPECSGIGRRGCRRDKQVHGLAAIGPMIEQQRMPRQIGLVGRADAYAVRGATIALSLAASTSPDGAVAKVRLTRLGRNS